MITKQPRNNALNRHFFSLKDFSSQCRATPVVNGDDLEGFPPTPWIFVIFKAFKHFDCSDSLQIYAFQGSDR